MADKPMIKEKEKRRVRRTFSRIWIVPALALIVSIGLAINNYLNRDVMIQVDFPSAGGIVEGKTELRFNNIKVGEVQTVEFSENLKEVQVHIGVEREMARYIDADAKFWLVEPQITASRITGLETLLSGDYINGEWDATIIGHKTHFKAEKKAPIIGLNEKGTEFHLRAPVAKSLSLESPIYYRGVKVGVVRDVQLNAEGQAVTIAIFINAPYDQFISTATRFWNASGIKMDLNTSGLEFQVASIATLIQGGVEFSNAFSGGNPVTSDTVFDLYSSQAAAESSQLDDDLRGLARVTSVFDSSVRGLSVGSDVQYKGLKIGHVVSISAIPNTDPKAKSALKMVVSYTIIPGRVGLHGVVDPQETYQELAKTVTEKNLRARLVPQSILGGLMINIFEDSKATETLSVDMSGSPYPIMPSVETEESSLQAAAVGVLNKVSDLRLQDVLDDVRDVLQSANALLVNDDTRRIPKEVAGLLENANNIVGSEDFQKIPDQVNAIMSDITETLNTIREGQAAENLVAALDNFKMVASNSEIASAKFPIIVDNVNTLVDKANSLPMQKLIDSTDELVQTADRFLQAGIDEDIPEALSGALVQVKETLRELREGGTTENLNATLRSARDAMASIQKAADELPDLANRLKILSASATETVKGYDPTSPIYRKLSATISDVDEAVKSMNALIRLLERKPNSILTGR